MSVWASHRCTLLSGRPISRHTSAIDLPERRIKATVSALNSLVNLRLERFSILADSIGAKYPPFSGVRRSGSTPLPIVLGRNDGRDGDRTHAPAFCPGRSSALAMRPLLRLSTLP